MSELLSFDADNVQFAWDATSISNYQKCPRYYQYVNLLGWQPKNKSVHLVFGGHYASALEHFHKHLASGDDYETATIKVVRELFINTWEFETDEDGNRIDDSGSPWESLHNSKTRETLIRSVVWYLDHWKNDPAKLVTLSDGTPAVELSFSLPVDNDIIFCGHLDKLVDYNGYYVMDQKTSQSTITQRFFEGFSPDNQMSMYSFSGSILFDLPIKGVLIDAAQIAVGFTRFERGFVPRAKQQLAEWYDDTMTVIENAREATRNNRFIPNRMSCSNYGGCAFRDICNRIPEHRERFLQSNFQRQERWDPLKRR